MMCCEHVNGAASLSLVPIRCLAHELTMTVELIPFWANLLCTNLWILYSLTDVY